MNKYGTGMKLKWICPRCSVASTRRHLSTSTIRAEEDQQKPTQLPKTSRARPSRKVLSLIQPTGVPHLGNYLGALRQWKQFQDEKTTTDQRRRRNHSLYFGLADLHSLTLKQDRDVRRANIKQSFASLLAIGLDPAQSKIFVQSQRPEHAELMWILSNVASTGYLSRMTQWKDKLGLEGSDRSLENLDEKSREALKLSLFSYPVLQAADILLYGADTVPVGEDQSQHVEFTRHLARSFNSMYCKDLKRPVLIPPTPLLSSAKRIMSLQNPSKKMSKSDPDEASRILITDSADAIKAKLNRAKTDSVSGHITYDPQARPGVSNLIEILKHVMQSPQSPEEIASEHADMNLAAFKARVADEIIKELDGVKERYDALMHPSNPTIDDAMISGNRYTGAKAGAIMKEVRAAVGLYDPRG